MGKKKKMNRMISRWIKSDLPDDCSPVLLLGVAKIPTSPKPAVRSVAGLPKGEPPCKTIAKRRFIVTPCKETAVSAPPPPLNAADAPTETARPSIAVHVIGPTPASTIVAMDHADIRPSIRESPDWPEEPSKLNSVTSAVLPSEPRLPSYLSLACTVNGYSATTNYDPDRLARSRDTSPHRPLGHHATDNLTATYAVCNNLLSPPNLVPLPPVVPAIGGDMSENGVTVSVQSTAFRHDYHHHHHQLTTTLKSYNASDSVDACADHGFKGPVVAKELSYGKENGGKSFIQQRVERLYGPGALAQGFFVMKKQKSKSYETEHIVRNGQATNERHSKSMNEQTLLDDGDISDNGMTQSSSTPSLPVLRHLRPEFRAQLPITVKTRPQKSATAIPPLPEENAVNGHGPHDAEMNCGFVTEPTSNKKKSNDTCDKIRLHGQKYGIVVKDGHYFMTVLEKETKRLLALASAVEEELESPDLDEDAKGFLRSASGKAKLLVSQKMQQFKGLCRNNVTQVAGEAFPTTNEDLQGFWDMIMLQVRQVDDLFAEIDRLRQNNWKEEIPVSTSSSTVTNGKAGLSKKLVKVPSRPVSAVAEENRKLREMQRKKMIEEKRRAMKEQQQRNKTPRQSIEIYVPESS